ncbi:MAG: hypothetical protein V7631_3487 [Massilia sp.]|jgi:hypothetical protein
MIDTPRWSLRDLALAAVALAFVLVVQGAVPFLMAPTLGQAVWSMGFAQSFANGSLFDVYAHHIGQPQPAAIAFGLAGAWPASLLIRLGLHPADAYAAMAAAWLGLAMWSAYALALRFGSRRPVALLGAVAWMSMPVVWAHAGYSMLSIGIALLSFYFMAAFRLFLVEPGTTRITPAIALYFSAAIVSVFMDGYTFMMFAAGASILLLYLLFTRPDLRPALARMALPVHLLSFALAYVLFSTFVGKSNFEAHPIDFFRGWGLDLSFVAIPTKGVFWLPDLLGLSMERSDARYFGDASVWVTTFAFPVLVFGLFAWWCVRRRKPATGVLLVALFGFYMALGPSLKINSTKPETLQLGHPRQESALMAPEFALGPTGNAWISENLPGFNVMRASYRWSALGVFGLWLLVMLSASRTEGKQRPWLLALALIILFNLPDMRKQWQQGVDHRSMFRQIDQDLVSGLRRDVRPAETVVFLPWRNDFIVNYLAPRSGFRSFNIGGDKNLAMAQAHWPEELKGLGGELDASKVPAAIKLLMEGHADVLVLPYFHTLWSPHLWPCVAQTSARLSKEQKDALNSIPDFMCPAERRTQLRPVLLALRESPYLDVVDSERYATIRLRPEFAGRESRQALLNSIYDKIAYPIVMSKGFEQAPHILAAGWHATEEHHVWSLANARLRLPVPTACEAAQCAVQLKFGVFGASPARPVAVVFSGLDKSRPWSEKILATSGDPIQVKLPLHPGAVRVQDISVSVPEATSPLALSGAPDGRVLGIALQQIALSGQ